MVPSVSVRAERLASVILLDGFPELLREVGFIGPLRAFERLVDTFPGSDPVFPVLTLPYGHLPQLRFEI